MGRIRFKAIAIALTILVATGLPVFAAGNSGLLEENLTTVTNELPAITVYSPMYDTNKDCPSKDSMEIRLVDEQNPKGVKAKIAKVSMFEKGEGTAYFILIDVSTSMNEDDKFVAVKQGLKKFIAKGNITAADKVYLIPFAGGTAKKGKAYNVTTEEFKRALNRLSADDENGTSIYKAISELKNMVNQAKDDDNIPARKVAIIFTDAKQSQAAGEESRIEAERRIKRMGMPVYAFSNSATDNKKALKQLGKLVSGTNGKIYNKCDTAKMYYESLVEMEEIIQNTVVIEALAKNAKSISETFDVNIFIEDENVATVKGVKANKSENVKDSFSVTMKNLLRDKWWGFAIAALAILVAIVLLVIKKNKGIIRTEKGALVYGKNVEEKVHFKGSNAEKKKIKIIVNKSNNETTMTDIQINGSIIVGRASNCNVYFDDAKMSRQHFALEVIGGEVYISDLESTGGTYLNGVKVYMKQKIGNGDTIAAGSTRIKIEW